MSDKTYTLTLRIPVQAFDDPSARKKAAALLLLIQDTIGDWAKNAKLQETFTDKPPRQIDLQVGADNAR